MLERAPQQSPAFVVDAFGVAVAIGIAGAERDAMMREACAAWGRCLVPGREPESTVDVVVDASPEVLAAAREDGALPHASVASALHHVSSVVTIRAIEARIGALVMLHAAGVAGADGSVVGFVAPSGTGKTTLARALGARYGYVTDETLAVRSDLGVIPYPKPLSVIEPGSSVKRQWGPDDLGLLRTPAEMRLRRLVILDRSPDAPSTPSLAPIPHLEGIATLAEQVSALSRTPGRLHALSDLVDGVGGLSRLTYREARDVLPLMPELLAAADS